MGFDEVRFPVDIAFGSSGGPEYTTHIVATVGGHEQRNADWSSARARYNVAHGIKTQEQLNILLAFFRARKGRAQGFRFKDWTDYRAKGERLGQGNGIRKTFQLLKEYRSGESAEIRIVTKPVEGSVRIFVNNVQKINGYAIDYTKGTVIFSVAPAIGEMIAADFEFDVPVRFDTDHLSARLDNNGTFSWMNIPLIEVRGA